VKEIKANGNEFVKADHRACPFGAGELFS